jgi:hypothetical protein
MTTAEWERRSGQHDPAATLLDRLPQADPEYLLGAAENPLLDERLVLALLRNRRTPQRLLADLAHDPRFSRSYGVRAGIARHPQAPRGIALHLIAHLYWRDLAAAADDVRVPAPVRRAAGRQLEMRIDGLALGEQLALARTGGRAVVQALRRTRLARVAEVLLGNPHLVEDDLVALARSPETPPEVLATIGRERRWVARYPIRLALAQNLHTPIGVALGMMSGLARADLAGLAARAEGPEVLRMAAARVLRERQRPEPPDPAPQAG